MPCPPQGQADAKVAAPEDDQNGGLTMIMRILSFMAGLYGEIGPGLILAVALPFTLLLLVLVLGEAVRRLRSKGAETAAG